MLACAREGTLFPSISHNSLNLGGIGGGGSENKNKGGDRQKVGLGISYPPLAQVSSSLSLVYPRLS